jgi:uncharacterized protein (TIGR00730 family)
VPPLTLDGGTGAMNEKRPLLCKAYRNEQFLSGRKARPIRILAEYLEPEGRFEDLNVSDTIVFFGSARIPSREEAEAQLREAEAGDGNVERARHWLEMSRYYEDARTLAGRLTEWSKDLENHRRRFVVCTGGGPGIMQAANRGASEARGMNIGFNVSLPLEQHQNPYVTRQLLFEFHYFFMRKFWFVYLAKAIVVFPGGMGTLDELFEILTLVQTRKVEKRLPVVLYGTGFWETAINFEALARFGVIDEADLNLFHLTDSVDDAFDYITRELGEYALGEPGWSL